MTTNHTDRLALADELERLRDAASPTLFKISPKTAAELLRLGAEYQRPRTPDWSAINYDADGAIVSALLRKIPTILAALREAPVRNERAEIVEETGWLIELPYTASGGGRLCWVALKKDRFPRYRIRGHYDDFNSEKAESPLEFTSDSLKALRFARKEDAELFMSVFDNFLLHAVATEHAWVAPITAIERGDHRKQEGE